MKWTEEKSAEFRTMYAEGHSFPAMAKHFGVGIKSIRGKWSAELGHGRMQGLTDKRRKSRLQGSPDPVLGTLIEDGVEITLYAARFAQGCTPQIGACIKARR